MTIFLCIASFKSKKTHVYNYKVITRFEVRNPTLPLEFKYK